MTKSGVVSSYSNMKSDGGWVSFTDNPCIGEKVGIYLCGYTVVQGLNTFHLPEKSLPVTIKMRTRWRAITICNGSKCHTNDLWK